MISENKALKKQIIKIKRLNEINENQKDYIQIKKKLKEKIIQIFKQDKEYEIKILKSIFSNEKIRNNEKLKSIFSQIILNSRNNSINQTKKERINKRAKLQSMGHNLKNKVNNLLNEFEVNEKIDSMMLNQQINPNPNTVDLPIIIPKINPNIEKDSLEKEKIKSHSTLPYKENAKNKNNNSNSLNLNNIENNLKTVKKKIKKLQKGSFMTGVGLTKTKKEPIPLNPKPNEKDEMMNNINTQINAILKNIDDEDEPKKVYKDIKNLKNSADFKNIIEEIDSYTNEIHEEFDEIKYLIKFADNTHKLIDRHKNVMTNIFRGAGLRPSKRIEEEEKLKNERGKIKK